MRRLFAIGLLGLLFTLSICAQRVIFISQNLTTGTPDPAISFIGQCNGTTSCASVPSHAVGDLFIAFAGRDASTTAPTLPSGWTSVTTASINGTSTADSVIRVACKVATSTSETITGFTNAGNLVAHIYRGARADTTANCAANILGTPSNFTSTVNTTTTTVTYNSITNGDSASWDVGFAYTPAATAGTSTAPTGMVNRSLSGSTKAAGQDTNGGVSSFATANVTVTTAGRVITSTMEIKAAQASTPTFVPSFGAPPQSVSISSATSGAGPYIYYTTDGSSPTTGSNHGTSVSVSSDPTTVKAAVLSMPGWSDSGVGSATYSSSSAISFDSVSSAGGSSSSGSTTLSFNHTLGGSANLIVAGFCIDSTAGTNMDTWTFAATYNGVPMTELNIAAVNTGGSPHQNPGGDTQGAQDLFYLLAPATGAHNVVLTVTGGTPTNIVGGSVAFSGATSVGTPVAAAGNSGTALTTVSNSAGDIVIDNMCGGSTIASSTQVNRWLNNLNNAGAAGNGASSTSTSTGSVGMQYSLSSDAWAITGVSLH